MIKQFCSIEPIKLSALLTKNNELSFHSALKMQKGQASLYISK